MTPDKEQTMGGEEQYPPCEHHPERKGRYSTEDEVPLCWECRWDAQYMTDPEFHAWVDQVTEVVRRRAEEEFNKSLDRLARRLRRGGEVERVVNEYHPAHYRSWARTWRNRQGYESIMTVFLDDLADALEASAPTPTSEKERDEALVGNTLDEAFQRTAEWAMEEFGDAEPMVVAYKLHGEVKELLEDPTDAEEMADVAMLVCRLASVTGTDLVSAIFDKLEVNRSREWETAPDGTKRHVPDPHTRAEGAEGPTWRDLIDTIEDGFDLALAALNARHREVQRLRRLQTDPDEGSEPVAWRWRRPGYDWRVTEQHPEKRTPRVVDYEEVQPLYAPKEEGDR